MTSSGDFTPLVTRTNTILYCVSWSETVQFYRHVFGLQSTFENDWFVELEVAVGSYLSIADAARATVEPSGGDGVTLSWRVADLDATCRHLTKQDVVVTEPKVRWGATTVFLHDPEGNRIELWTPVRDGAT